MKNCPKCGKNLKTLDKYCPDCGSFEDKNIEIQIVMYIVIFVVCLGLFMVQDMWRDKNKTDVTEESRTVNEEYTKIFLDRNIEDHSDLEVMEGREYKEYAVIDEENVIRKMEFAYTAENDTVLDIVETAFFPITSFSTEEIKEFDNEIKKDVEELEKLSFVETEHEITKRYYILKISYKYLDDPSHVSVLSPLSKINSESWCYDDKGVVSAMLTEFELQYAGYVKKSFDIHSI